MTTLRSMVLQAQVAVHSRLVARAEWNAFLEEFSRRHAGWLASLRARDEGAGGEQVVARQLPLERVEFDEEGDRIRVHLGSGKTKRILYPVEAPISLRVDVGEDGAEWGLEIHSSGRQTRLRFRSSLPTEMVDGILRMPS
jgi:hypothetical protein